MTLSTRLHKFGNKSLEKASFDIYRISTLNSCNFSLSIDMYSICAFVYFFEIALILAMLLLLKFVCRIKKCTLDFVLLIIEAIVTAANGAQASFVDKQTLTTSLFISFSPSGFQ